MYFFNSWFTSGSWNDFFILGLICNILEIPSIFDRILIDWSVWNYILALFAISILGKFHEKYAAMKDNSHYIPGLSSNSCRFLRDRNDRMY